MALSDNRILFQIDKLFEAPQLIFKVPFDPRVRCLVVIFVSIFHLGKCESYAYLVGDLFEQCAAFG
jgi:hypothetical protein